MKGPGKAPAPSKVKKEVVGGSSCSQKPREPREPGRPEKLAETEAAGPASSSNGAGAENIKRKSRLEVKRKHIFIIIISVMSQQAEIIYSLEMSKQSGAEAVLLSGRRERTQPLSWRGAGQL